MSLTPSATQARILRSILRNKGTWEMSEEELARVVAGHYGWVSREGGWIYTPKGKPIAHGWQGLAIRLRDRGQITVGKGVNWRRLPSSN